MSNYDVVKLQIGESIRTLRKSKGFTQSSFAARVGKSRFWLTAIEKGTNFPTIEGVYQIADALECSVYAIFPKNFVNIGEPVISAPNVDLKQQASVMKKLERFNG
jgi:transcriptional regulator with XRE-family HTH domain